jgi:Phosphoglycerol transferase and related proteins, alkaline phosphatase superfamily
MNQRVRAALLSPFALFTVLLTVKFYMASAVVFDGSVWNPLVTSLPSVWAAFALIELLADRRKTLAYAAVDLIYTCVYFAVIMYYKYFGIIVTYHAFSQIGQVKEVKGSVFQLLHPYFLLIFADLVVMALLAARHRGFRRWASRPRPSRAFRMGAAVLFIVMFAVCALQVVPNRDIVNELARAERMGIINYEVDVMLTSKQEMLFEPSVVTPAAVREVKRLPRPAVHAYWRAAEGRHVVFVQLEAFQTILLDLEVDGVEVTPVLNRLKEEGVYFPRFFQQVGAGNTSDAEYTANTSLLTPPAGAASETYGDKALPGLPKLFHARGYEAVTFHTNDVKFWHRDALYPALGFDRYYDQQFFKDEDFVHFGSSDEVLYRKSVAEMARLANEGERIYANLISMSAHHPFNLPAHKDTFDLPGRFRDTFVGDYLRSQHYADSALGVFIEEMKAAGLWDNSLIVIYGDHMGMPVYSLTKEDRSLLKELLGRTYGYQDMLRVPLLLVAPGALEPQTIETVGGQSDIMPTVANLAGIRLDGSVVFGQDLLNYRSNLLPIRYYLPTGSFINDRAIFVPGEGFGDGTVYPLDGGKPVGADSVGEDGAPLVTEDEYRRALDLFRMSHSYISQLPERTRESGRQSS